MVNCTHTLLASFFSLKSLMMNSIGGWLYRYCGDTVAGVMATAWLVSSSTRLCCCSVCSFISPRGSRTEQPVLGQSTSWWATLNIEVLFKLMSSQTLHWAVLVGAVYRRPWAYWVVLLCDDSERCCSNRSSHMRSFACGSDDVSALSFHFYDRIYRSQRDKQCHILP